MKKNGIVLMMTLVLITVLMGIVALVLTQNSNLSKHINSGFTHSATLRIVNDLERELPSLLSSITGAEELDIAMRLPLQIESKKGDFMLKATLSSPYSKLNINNLCDSNGTLNKSYYDVWLRLFNYYPIADSEIFLKLVLDTIDTDLNERGIDTEIAWTQSDFKNTKIASMEQFSHILERYILLTRDKSVLKIPWEKYVGFEGERVDINAMSHETLSLLLPSVPTETLRQITTYRTKAFTSKEEAIAKEPLLSGIFDPFLFIYQANSDYVLVCDVEISENSHSEKVRFDYSLFTKKISTIEFL